MRETARRRAVRRALAAALAALACGSEGADEPVRRGSEPAGAAGSPVAAPLPPPPGAGTSAPAGPAPAAEAEPTEPTPVGASGFSQRVGERRQERAALGPEERRAYWRRRLGLPEDPEERRRMREAGLARDAALVPQLDSEDAGARLEAVRDVDLQGPGRERVFALASDDPDAAVRAAAFERLYEEPAATAQQIARRGLFDPEPSVVLVAIEVLSLFGDESSVAELETLASEHPDAKVREAAHDAVEALR